jgi:hypothetical protein
MYACGSFMMTVADVMFLPMCIANMIEFTLVYFWIELRQFLFRQKYHFWKVLMSSVLWYVMF